MENQKNNQLQIELKDEVAQGTYANLAIITHSSSEFIVDFVRVMPGLPKGGRAVSYHFDTRTCQATDVCPSGKRGEVRASVRTYPYAGRDERRPGRTRRKDLHSAIEWLQRRCIIARNS